MSSSLKNKVVLLTGAGSGIGRCMANEFAREGARLILTDLNHLMLEETIEHYGIRSSVLGCIEVNFMDSNAVDMLVKQAFELAPRIDVLYNNAGYMILGQFRNLREDDIHTLKRINLDTPIQLTQALIPHMIENGGGYLGFTCSSSATATPPGASIYGMTKAGLAAFAEALNAELYAYNISVTRVCPGFVKTPLVKKASYRDKQIEERTNSVPQFFGSTPEKVARMSVRALRNKRAFLIIGGDEHLKYFLKNYMHFLYVRLNRLMAKLLLDAPEK